MTSTNSTTEFILSDNDLKRFWAFVKVDPITDAWLWTGAKTGGYGRFYLRGKNPGAHRVSYFLAYGPIPENMHVCHKHEELGCHNINPKHLFLGTQKDNMQDAAKKGRMKRGEEIETGKLKVWQVLDIAVSDDRYGVLKARHGINVGAIGSIKRGEAWAHVTGIDKSVARLSSTNTTGYTGVRSSGKKWRARIKHKVNGKTIFVNLGSHHDKVDAALAYDKAARELHGDKARLNFP